MMNTTGGWIEGDKIGQKSGKIRQESKFRSVKLQTKAAIETELIEIEVKAPFDGNAFE